ncbi:hypothetical protein Trydic_g22108 [Trypoxylus dichotomus]
MFAECPIIYAGPPLRHHGIPTEEVLDVVPAAHLPAALCNRPPPPRHFCHNYAVTARWSTMVGGLYAQSLPLSLENKRPRSSFALSALELCGSCNSVQFQTHIWGFKAAQPEMTKDAAWSDFESYSSPLGLIDVSSRSSEYAKYPSKPTVRSLASRL